MSSPLSGWAQSMAHLPSLGEELAAVDADVVPVGPVRPVGAGRAGSDGSAVFVRSRAREPGPGAADPIDHVCVRVADLRQPKDPGVEPLTLGAPRAAGGRRVHEL